MKFDESSLYNIQTNLTGTRYSLFNLASWKNGIAFKKIDFSENGVPVIKIAELNNGIGGTTAYTQQKFPEDVHLRQGDLLFSWSGNPQTSIDIFRFSLVEGWLNQHIFKTTPNPDLVDRDFFYYLMKSLKPHFTQIATNKQTTGLGHVTIADIKRMSVIVPALDVQKKIASYIKPIDDKIMLNNAINKNLLQQALAVYKAWFCDYILSDGVFPESWHITTVDALSSLVTRGIAPKYDDNSNQIVLNQKCIRDHTIDVSLARRHLPKKINEKWICKGDLLINSTGTGTLGRVAQVWFDANNMTVDSHVTIVRPKSSILQSYIGFWGFSHESEIEAQHTGSTGQTELPRDRVKAMELPLPDEDTLSKFNELVIPMTDAVVSNQKENARLTQLRDTLLPKLMSGELDVSDIEI